MLRVPLCRMPMASICRAAPSLKPPTRALITAAPAPHRVAPICRAAPPTRALSTAAAPAPPTTVTWGRTGLALLAGSATVPCWMLARETLFKPLAETLPLGSPFFSSFFASISVRTVLGPTASRTLLFCTVLGSFAVDFVAFPFLVAFGAAFLVEKSVSVSDDDAAAIGARCSHLCMSQERVIYAKGLWLALKDARAADGDDTEIHRGMLTTAKAQVFFEEMAAQMKRDTTTWGPEASHITAQKLCDTYDAVFELLDQDANGKLTFKEFASGMLTIGALLQLPHKKFPSEAEKLDYTFTCMDVDESGYLELDELVAFARVIHNLGGLLPEEELHRRSWWYSPLSAVGLAKGWLAACDTNRDGKIDRAEFAKLGPRLQLDRVIAKLMPKGKDVPKDGDNSELPPENLPALGKA